VKILPSRVEDKILNHKRGGYCFELNEYFNYVLKELGYKAITKTARVLWERPPGEFSSRTHLINIVTLDDGRKFLCDVGMGTANPVSPLRLDTTEPQSTLYDTHGILPADHMT
jgi:N-hydroxyarylamine O-acetyltransferase